MSDPTMLYELRRDKWAKDNVHIQDIKGEFKIQIKRASLITDPIPFFILPIDGGGTRSMLLT